jgi:membrane protein YdbS with pleckstrin-like domain
MYKSFREFCEQLLRIPHDPSPPPGDEASTRIFRAAPNYYKYRLFLWAARTGFLLFVLIAAILLPTAIAFLAVPHRLDFEKVLLLAVEGIALLFHLFGSIFFLAVLRLDYEKRWYVVTDRSLRIREGVVNVREMTVNFANIQNISISQGPLQRLLRIADLRVDTAGGGGGRAANTHHAAQNLHTAWFRGIDNASEVRELIQDRLRHLKDSGLGDYEELLRSAAVASQSPQWSPQVILALREIHAEARALTRTIEAQRS